MTPFELGYVIGCFESEGHARIDNMKYPSIHIAQKDKRMLEYIQTLLPTWRLYTYDGMSRLVLAKSNEVHTFLTLIRPHLKVKGGQVDEVLAYLDVERRRKRLEPSLLQQLYIKEEILP